MLKRRIVQERINKGNGHWRDIVSLDQLDFRSMENAFAFLMIDPYGPLWDVYRAYLWIYRLKVVQMANRVMIIFFDESPAVSSKSDIRSETNSLW